MRRLPIIIAICFGLLANSGYVFAQDDSKKRSVTPFPKPIKTSFRVQVIISSDDPIIKNVIESYVKRELRSLGGVIVTDNDPEYAIEIVALHPETVEKCYINSIALSVVIRAPLNLSMIQVLAAATSLEKKEQHSIVRLYEGKDTLIRHFLLMPSIDNLRESCESIVADFYSDTLEPRRKLYEAINKEMRK
jgi:hypothetical protein